MLRQTVTLATAILYSLKASTAYAERQHKGRVGIVLFCVCTLKNIRIDVID